MSPPRPFAPLFLLLYLVVVAPTIGYHGILYHSPTNNQNREPQQSSTLESNQQPENEKILTENSYEKDIQKHEESAEKHIADGVLQWITEHNVDHKSTGKEISDKANIVNVKNDAMATIENQENITSEQKHEKENTTTHENSYVEVDSENDVKNSKENYNKSIENDQIKNNINSNEQNVVNNTITNDIHNNEEESTKNTVKLIKNHDEITSKSDKTSKLNIDIKTIDNKKQELRKNKNNFAVENINNTFYQENNKQFINRNKTDINSFSEKQNKETNQSEIIIDNIDNNIYTYSTIGTDNNKTYKMTEENEKSKRTNKEKELKNDDNSNELETNEINVVNILRSSKDIKHDNLQKTKTNLYKILTHSIKHRNNFYKISIKVKKSKPSQNDSAILWTKKQINKKTNLQNQMNITDYGTIVRTKQETNKHDHMLGSSYLHSMKETFDFTNENVNKTLIKSLKSLVGDDDNTIKGSRLHETTKKVKKNDKENNGNCSNNNFTKNITNCTDKNKNLEDSSVPNHHFKTPQHTYPTSRFNKRNKLGGRFETEKRTRARTQTVAERFVSLLPKSAAIRHPGGPNDKRVVSLLGLFELTTREGDRPDGRSELAAARLAVKHINERKLLPGYTLELLTNDTQSNNIILQTVHTNCEFKLFGFFPLKNTVFIISNNIIMQTVHTSCEFKLYGFFPLKHTAFIICDPGVGVDRFFHALYTQINTRMVMLLGSACSEVTESLAKVVPYWNMVQVSFGSTSPALSDRSEFPLFYRTVAPDSSHNPARIAFVQRFGWDSVAALSQNEDAYSLALNDLVTELEQANITCTATITFAETDFKEQLRVLKELDTRIIIGSFSHEVAPKIFCEAYSLGMFGADYAWILHGNGATTWWMNGSECTRGPLAEAVEGLILVSSHNSIVGSEPSFSGLTNAEFTEALLKDEQVPISKYAPQTYDAVWAIALALSNAEAAWSAANNTTVGHFDYTRTDMANEFLTQLGQLNFLGISGPVSFSGADRVGTSAFYQVQGAVVRTVALYYPGTQSLDFDCPACEPLLWQGDQVPIARRVIKLRVVTIPPAVFLAISSLAVCGISLALTFLAFNLHFRKLKSIKLSSPRLNNMTVVGCILVYVAVILLGLDHATLRVTDHFSTICTIRVYLLSAGFSLAFGSMFTKTYRVHRIFIRSRSGVVKDKLLQDTQLMSLICVLLLIDVLIVTLWVVIDPMQRHLRNLSLEISAVDRSVVYQPQVEVCRSQNTNGWLGALYVYKGLLLIVGVYMAWETRHVKIPALNDSQYIGMSVYSVVITSGIFVVLANLMSDRATLAFITMTTFILISTTTTLCLLFLPTLHAIMKRADNCDPVVQSMGLKIECNTRRFVTDDRRELQYRVEIQNKVYRREVAALDLEIGRLEKQLLEMNSQSCSSSTSSITAAKKLDLSPGEEIFQRDHPRTPSIGGGLPLLLLSVLPPVIPRASWPSAVQELPMRRSVTFSSEPKLDEQVSARRNEPAIDLYNLCLRPERFNEKVGVFGRLRNLFGSRPSIRKSSTASYAGNSNIGIAGALKAHMGYIAGLVPGTNKNQMASSCNTSSFTIHKLDGSVSAKELYSRRQSFARAGGSGPIISVTADIDQDDDDNNDPNDFRRKFSLGLCLTKKDDATDTSKVNFSLPLQRRKSITYQYSQPVLSFRERAKGSPRFPHRIVPTCSLNALEDRRTSSSSSTSQQLQLQQSALRRGSQQPSPLVINTNPKKRTSLSQQTATRWRSMEDATTTTLAGSRRGSGVLAISCLPSSAGPQPRAVSYSPNCDVWSTAEFGIPFSELGKTSPGKSQLETPQ